MNYSEKILEFFHIVMGGKLRKFNSIEQALKEVVRLLDDQVIKSSTGSSSSHFRKCSDEDDINHHVHFKDAVALDIACMRENQGHPLLSLHQTMIDRAMQSSNQSENVTSSLISMGARLGRLMETTQEALDPKSPGGAKIDKMEKQKIYKAIAAVEKRIVELKIAIGDKAE